MAGYHVVFEGTGASNSNALGVRTRKMYQSREEFEKFQQRSGNGDVILAEGVSDEEAARLIEEMPVEAWVNYLVRFAKDHQDPNLVRFEMRNVIFAFRFSGRFEEFKEALAEDPSLLVTFLSLPTV